MRRRLSAGLDAAAPAEVARLIGSDAAGGDLMLVLQIDRCRFLMVDTLNEALHFARAPSVVLAPILFSRIDYTLAAVHCKKAHHTAEGAGRQGCKESASISCTG